MSTKSLFGHESEILKRDAQEHISKSEVQNPNISACRILCVAAPRAEQCGCFCARPRGAYPRPSNRLSPSQDGGLPRFS